MKMMTRMMATTFLQTLVHVRLLGQLRPVRLEVVDRPLERYVWDDLVVGQRRV